MQEGWVNQAKTFNYHFKNIELGRGEFCHRYNAHTLCRNLQKRSLKCRKHCTFQTHDPRWFIVRLKLSVLETSTGKKNLCCFFTSNCMSNTPLSFVGMIIYLQQLSLASTEFEDISSLSSTFWLKKLGNQEGF